MENQSVDNLKSRIKELEEDVIFLREALDIYIWVVNRYADFGRQAKFVVEIEDEG